MRYVLYMFKMLNLKRMVFPNFLHRPRLKVCMGLLFQLQRSLSSMGSRVTVQVRIDSLADTNMCLKFTTAKPALVLDDQSHFSTITEIVSLERGKNLQTNVCPDSCTIPILNVSGLAAHKSIYSMGVNASY